MGSVIGCCRSRRNRPPLLLPNDLETGDIVLFKTKSCAACCTRVCTQGPWDHVAMILRTADGLRSVECTGAGVGCYILQERLDDPSVSVAAIRRLQTVTISDPMVANLNRFLQAVKDKPYRSAPCLWARQICADCCSCCFSGAHVPPRSPVLSTRRAKYFPAAPSSRTLGNVQMHSEDGRQLGFPAPSRTLRAAPDSVIVDMIPSRRSSFSVTTTTTAAATTTTSSSSVPPKDGTGVTMSEDEQWHVRDASPATSVASPSSHSDTHTLDEIKSPSSSLSSPVSPSNVPPTATTATTSTAPAAATATDAVIEAVVEARTASEQHGDDSPIVNNSSDIRFADSRGFFCSSFVAACYMHLGLLSMDPPPEAYMPLQFTEADVPPSLPSPSTSTNSARGVNVTASRSTPTPPPSGTTTRPSSRAAGSSSSTTTTSKGGGTKRRGHSRTGSTQPASTGRLPLLRGATLSSSVYLSPAPIIRPGTPTSVVTLPASPLPPIRSINDSKSLDDNTNNHTSVSVSVSIHHTHTTIGPNKNNNNGVKKDAKSTNEFDSIPHNA